MKQETTGKVKFGSWGVVLGAIIVMIIGFSWGGWKTSGTAQTMAQEAVVATQAEICIAQFMNDPNHEAKIKELKALDSWKRSEFIEKGGWDKMPGQEKGNYEVARACADGLEPLLKK